MQRRCGNSASRLIAASTSTTTLFQRRNFEHPSFNTDNGRDYAQVSTIGKKYGTAAATPSPDSLFECGSQFMPTLTTEMLGNVELELHATKNYYVSNSKGLDKYVIHNVSEYEGKVARTMFAKFVTDGNLSEWFDAFFAKYPAMNHPNCLGNEKFQIEFQDFILEAFSKIHEGEQAITHLCATFSLKLWEQRHIAPPYFFRVTEVLMDILDQQVGTPHDKRIQRRALEILTKIMHNSLGELPFWTAHTGGEIVNSDLTPNRVFHEPGLKEQTWGHDSSDIDTSAWLNRNAPPKAAAPLVEEAAAVEEPTTIEVEVEETATTKTEEVKA